MRLIHVSCSSSEKTLFFPCSPIWVARFPEANHHTTGGITDKLLKSCSSAPRKMLCKKDLHNNKRALLHGLMIEIFYLLNINKTHKKAVLPLNHSEVRPPIFLKFNYLRLFSRQMIWKSSSLNPVLLYSSSSGLRLSMSSNVWFSPHIPQMKV